MSLISKMQIGFSQSKKLLNSLGIDFRTNSFRKNPFDYTQASDNLKHALRKDDYISSYRIAKNEFDYALITNDERIFIFWYRQYDNVLDLHYYLLDRPTSHLSYPQFVFELGFDPFETGDELLEEYEIYLDEAPPNPTMTPIRYDYSPSLYTTLVHSASHLHIGFINDFRVPIRSIWTPFQFVCFSLKIFYFPDWKIGMNNPTSFGLFQGQKSHSINLPPTLWNDIDQKDYSLS